MDGWMDGWIAIKFAKFDAKGLNQSENIVKSFKSATLFWITTYIYYCISRWYRELRNEEFYNDRLPKQQNCSSKLAAHNE